jgi:hypothetical protein
MGTMHHVAMLPCTHGCMHAHAASAWVAWPVYRRACCTMHTHARPSCLPASVAVASTCCRSRSSARIAPAAYLCVAVFVLSCSQRFHGAFTGGFSAGYFNTVGSKVGVHDARCIAHSHATVQAPNNGCRWQNSYQPISGCSWPSVPLPLPLALSLALSFI